MIEMNEPQASEPTSTVPCAAGHPPKAVTRPSPAVVARLDGRLGPFTAGYVLVVAIAGPLAASRPHLLAARMPARLFPVPALSGKEPS